MIRPSPLFRQFLFFVVVSLVSMPASANWISIGPEGGGARDIVIDRSDPDRLLVLSELAGIFESIDGGASFGPLATTPIAGNGFPAPARLFKLEQHPTAPQILLGIARFGPSETDGGWRSSDGGDSWTRIDPEILRSDFAFNADGSRVYAWSSNGLAVSTDDGATWTNQPLTGPAAGLDTSMSLLQASPVDPGRVFVIAGGQLFRSDDGGQTWTLAALPAGGIVPNYLVISADANETLHAASNDEIYRSIDDGDSWNLAATGLTNPSIAFDPIRHLAIQRSTGAVFALSGGRIHRTNASGATWTTADLPTDIDFGNRIDFDPIDSNRMFISAGSGIFASTDGGVNWQMRKTGFLAHVVLQLVASRSVPGAVYANSNRLFRTPDAGSNWADVTPRTLLNDYASRPVDSATDPQVVVAAGDVPIRTTDGGTSWTLLPSPSGEPGRTIRVWSDPRDDSRIVSGEFGSGGGLSVSGLYLSEDAGSSWTRVGAAPAGRLNYQPNSVADDPTRPGTVFFGIHSRIDTTFSEGLIARSTDGGSTFEYVFDGMAFPSLTVDRAGTILVGGGEDSNRPGIWRSTDGGDTWEAVNNGIPLPSGINDITAHPTAPGHFAMTTFRELFVTDDNGATWQAVSRAGLGPGNAIRSVEILSGTGTALEMLVGTDRGVFYTSPALQLPSVPVPTLGAASLFVLALLLILVGLAATRVASPRPS